MIKVRLVHIYNIIKLNSLPDKEILDWSELKAFADDKMKVTKTLDFV